MYINVPIYGTFFIVMKGVFIMAVNEQIVTGRKFRKLIDEANKLWQRISFWTKASDVEFNDGKNAETKFGAINGVTDSLTSTASNIAASAKAVKTLNDKVTQLSSNMLKLNTGSFVGASKTITTSRKPVIIFARISQVSSYAIINKSDGTVVQGGYGLTIVRNSDTSYTLKEPNGVSQNFEYYWI